MNRREAFQGLGALGLAGFATPALAQSEAQSDAHSDAHSDAQTIARDAWIYGLPLIEMATTRARHLAMGAPQNHFFGGRALAAPKDRTVTNPNNDTLYLSAWIDLTQGPVGLTVPAVGDRYWSLAVMDMFSNNNAVLGSRTVGPDGGVFTLVGPDQPLGGPNPIRIATPHAWALARVLVDGPEDVAAVQALLKGFKLAGKAGPRPETYADRAAGPADYFDSVRRLLKAEPPPTTDLALLRRCAPLLVDGTALDPTAVEAGVAEARALVRGGWGRETGVDGWVYPRFNLGDYGQDYGYRAAVALGGLAALPRAEAIYLRSRGEKDGLYVSDRSWRLSMPADVPVDAFWSLSMYEATDDGQFFFTDNPLNRYAIGDRTRGLVRRTDGGVDLWIGRTDPGGARTANWLPAPKAAPWIVTWRAYLPKPALVHGQWRLPAIVEV